MASGKSNEFAAAILDHIFGVTAYAPAANVWIALSTEAFDPALTGSTIVEPDPANGYARVEVANDGTTWDAAALDALLNVVVTTSLIEMDFATPTADLGDILSAYILDAAAAGMILYGADLPAPLPATAGSPLSVPAGAIVIEDFQTS